MKEKKTDNINMKIAPSLKQKAKKMADMKNLTVSQYIAGLIEADIRREANKQAKFLVEKIGIGGMPSSTEAYETQEEANERAISLWGELDDDSKKKYHIFVSFVTEGDIDPNAIEIYKKEGGEFPWTQNLHSWHVNGNFNSSETDVKVEIKGSAIEYTVRGAIFKINISERLKRQKEEKENGTFDEVNFAVKSIEEDIATIEEKIHDTLFFSERNKIYEALTDFYE